MNFLKAIKKPDIIIIGFLLVTAIIFSAIIEFKQTQDNLCAEIVYSGNIVSAVDLSINRTFSLPELPNIIFEVNDGKIAFIKSDCPDKICVKTGFISKAGQTAACLPNKAVIHINHAENNDDANDIDANDIDAIIK